MNELLAVAPNDVIDFVFEWGLAAILVVIIAGIIWGYIKGFFGGGDSDES